MRCLSFLIGIGFVLTAAPLLAQVKPVSPVADLSVETLENDHEFFEIEVTIAQWAAPDGENRPNDQQLKLDGDRDEIAARIGELQKEGVLTGVHRVRLTAPNKMSAMVQVGMDQPRVTGSQFGPRGNTVSSINYQSVGTVVRVTPRSLHENRIAVELEVSKSGLATPPDAPVLSEGEAGRTIKADATRTMMLKTIASVTSGQTILVSGLQQPNEGELVLLSARKLE